LGLVDKKNASRYEIEFVARDNGRFVF